MQKHCDVWYTCDTCGARCESEDVMKAHEEMCNPGEKEKAGEWIGRYMEVGNGVYKVVGVVGCRLHGEGWRRDDVYGSVSPITVDAYMRDVRESNRKEWEKCYRECIEGSMRKQLEDMSE